MELKFALCIIRLILVYQKKLYLQIVDAIISHGCFLRECNVEHSIVGVRSRLEYGVELKVSHSLPPNRIQED